MVVNNDINNNIKNNNNNNNNLHRVRNKSDDEVDASFVSTRYLFSCLSVVESLDNGKSIRETRDADIPLVVRHFYHHAGWAQLMDTEMAEWKSVGR